MLYCLFLQSRTKLNTRARPMIDSSTHCAIHFLSRFISSNNSGHTSDIVQNACLTSKRECQNAVQDIRHSNEFAF